MESSGSTNFESLKAEVIKILKNRAAKENEEELKKAVQYFNNSESYFTYLDKSDNGKWIEKAGYGVGTIRIWKGKKYKKVSASPTRWVRVFDKVDRGAKSSMTRLIHKAQECKDAEALYQFCLSNHALFQDENGVDLPIMDKLRAAIDEQKKKVGDGLDGSKHFSNSKVETQPMEPGKVKQIHDKMEENKKKGKKVTPYEAQKQIDNEELDKKVKQINEDAKKKESENTQFYNENIKGQDEKFRYMLLSRMQSDVEYYKRQGGGTKLWADNITEQLNDMQELYDSFSEKKKPEWITQKDIDNYKKELLESEAEKTEKKNTWNDLSKDEKDKKLSDYATGLMDYSTKEYEALKAAIAQGKKGLIGGGDDIPDEEKYKILNQLIESEEKSKAENTQVVKLSDANKKAFNDYAAKFDNPNRTILRYPSEVEIDGKKRLAYSDGHFLVVTNDIPEGVKTKQSEKIEGNFPNVARVIPNGFKDGTSEKIDIDLDDVMAKLPKVGFAKKNFDDDSQKQYMKIGKHWYDAKQVKATYDILKGGKAIVVTEGKPDEKVGKIGIKTDKGYSVIMSLNDDSGEHYQKQAIYDSDKGSMSAKDVSDYEIKKRTGLNDTYFNNAVEFGFTPDKKGIMYGSDKNIGFRGKGRNTEFFYKGYPTGDTFYSDYMYGTKENIQERINMVKERIDSRMEEFKKGHENPVKINPETYDKTFKNMTDDQLKNIYKWWTDPKNLEGLLYKGSTRKGVPGISSGYVDARRLGAVEEAVTKMLPDIKAEIQNRGISIKKSIEGEIYFESSLENYVRKSIKILQKSLIW